MGLGTCSGISPTSIFTSLASADLRVASKGSGLPTPEKIAPPPQFGATKVQIFSQFNLSTAPWKTWTPPGPDPGSTGDSEQPDASGKERGTGGIRDETRRDGTGAVARNPAARTAISDPLCVKLNNVAEFEVCPHLDSAIEGFCRGTPRILSRKGRPPGRA